MTSRHHVARLNFGMSRSDACRHNPVTRIGQASGCTSTIVRRFKMERFKVIKAAVSGFVNGYGTGSYGTYSYAKRL